MEIENAIQFILKQNGDLNKFQILYILFKSVSKERDIEKKKQIIKEAYVDVISHETAREQLLLTAVPIDDVDLIIESFIFIVTNQKSLITKIVDFFKNLCIKTQTPQLNP